MLFSTEFFNSMHFDPLDQAEFIKAHGTSTVVFPVLTCPCIREEQQHDPTCQACQGTGAYYPGGISYATTLLLHEENSKRDYLDPGTWIAGSIRASVLPGYRLTERDKVRWVDIKDVFADEVLTRGLQDSVRFEAGVEIIAIADLERVYRQGVDYTLTPPNTVSWLPGGSAPSFMAQYSIKYYAYPDYLVVNDSPRLRVEHRIPQSQEVVLLRADKINRD